MHETHIVFENLSNIKRDMLQKAWGLNIGEGGINDVAIGGLCSALLCMSISLYSNFVNAIQFYLVLSNYIQFMRHKMTLPIGLYIHILR